MDRRVCRPRRRARVPDGALVAEPLRVRLQRARGRRRGQPARACVDDGALARSLAQHARHGRHVVRLLCGRGALPHVDVLLLPTRLDGGVRFDVRARRHGCLPALPPAADSDVRLPLQRDAHAAARRVPRVCCDVGAAVGPALRARLRRLHLDGGRARRVARRRGGGVPAQHYAPRASRRRRCGLPWAHRARRSRRVGIPPDGARRRG
mmetsp:Transcript_5182/g.16235  ORF Transcript_5182/g.16235 Transcript_5182/m.16235 type:complete len:208 (-) Transcript_5182:502-1125(-)